MPQSSSPRSGAAPFAVLLVCLCAVGAPAITISGRVAPPRVSPPPATPPPVDTGEQEAVPGPVSLVTALSSRILKVALQPGAADLGTAPVLLRSASDSSGFYAGAGQMPVATGSRVAAGQLLGDWAPVTVVLAREVVLHFAEDLTEGAGYLLQGGGAAPWRVEYTHHLLGDGVNGSVKTNHLGYRPEDRKYGYLGNYMGTAGPMPLSPEAFEVVDAASGVVAYRGVPLLRGDDPSMSGERVYECDFTEFRQPGRYTLRVPGIGRSHEFGIAVDVYAEAYAITARALYYQRCGLDLSTPYADSPYARDACHLQAAQIHSSHADSPLGGDELPGTEVDVRGGWHDAGDYGRYVPTAAAALFHLFTAFELYPGRFGDGGLNLPETGNGVPDILDEARWEVEWLLRMQADDGGVFHKVTSPKYPTTMPAVDHQQLYLAPKTTHSTALFAASMAAAARVLTPYFPETASNCLAAARRAWAFLEGHPAASPAHGFRNPEGIGGGEYGDSEGDRDERAWAAAELYKTTGEAAFHDAFGPLWETHPPTWGWNAFQHHQRKASWAYATAQHPKNEAYVEAYRREARIDANVAVRRTEASVYRGAYRSSVPQFIGWGAFAQSTRYAWDLILASYLLADPSLVQAVRLNIDPQLGNNPQSRTYITGLGYDSPMNPLHHPSLHDGVVAPVPGLTLFGPHAELSGSNPFYQAARNAFEPAGVRAADPYPVLRRFVDQHQLVPMSEFTILEVAEAAVVYAFLSGEGLDVRLDGGPDGDGQQGLADLDLYLIAYRDGEPSADTNGDGVVTLDDALMFIHLHLSRLKEGPAARAARQARDALLQETPAAGAQHSYPNPFNASTHIPFELSEPGRVKLDVYDMLGRRIRTLVDGPLDTGRHAVAWDGANADGDAVASGVYLYRLQTVSATRTGRMVLAE